jgi:hypothetical protein
VGQTAFIRTDSYIIDAALQPKGRVIMGAVTVVATLVLGVTLTHAFGILGLTLGMLLGRGIQSISYPIIVRKCIDHPERTLAGRIEALRLAAMTAALFIGANIFSRHVQATSWPVWLLGVMASLLVFAALALFVAPTATTRRKIIRRLRNMALGLRKRREVEPVGETA